MTVSNQSSSGQLTRENVSESNVTVKPLIVRSVDNDKSLPKETQMAQCTITSGDIKASAQATFSKKLEGFCSTDDMNDLKRIISTLELKFLDEIYYLRNMIQSLLPQHFHYQPHMSHQQYQTPYSSYHEPNYRYQMPVNQRNYYNHYSDTSHQQTTQRTFIPTLPTTQQSMTASTSEHQTIYTTKAPEVLKAMKHDLKSLEINKSRLSKKIEETTTQETITTPQATPTKNEYTYYWKLENFPEVFNHAKKSEVFSHVFNVKGLFLRIRATLQEFDNQNLLLGIEHLANIENSDKMEIEISDGLVFKEIAEEKLFQYSFSIMDQSRPNHDLISPIYWNTDSESYLIPNSFHLLANYLKLRN
ncbi:CLUMA_CG006103, isoform A [Clunio marinus]|uniref:CLUMA_CG006103, isoform A n=1 Tax=Clunio marinus TaxID=568069 RepID=A0A1J1HY71_9DIPT|nr:CLUMA_CG006103, isoform A [Clunio marinus]